MVLFSIRMLVVMAVMGGPPKRAFLGRGAAEEGEEELKRAARFVAAVRKIAVKRPRNPKFPGEEHEGAKRHGFHVNPGPEHGEASDVNEEEKDTGKRDTDASMHKL